MNLDWLFISGLSFLWIKSGRTRVTLLLVKRYVIEKLAARHDTSVFAEADTYLGRITLSILSVFNNIYTIELDRMLYLGAKRKFNDMKHVKEYISKYKGWQMKVEDGIIFLQRRVL